MLLASVLLGSVGRSFADDPGDPELDESEVCTSSDKAGNPCRCDVFKPSGGVGAACVGSCVEYNCTCNEKDGTTPKKKQCLPESAEDDQPADPPA